VGFAVNWLESRENLSPRPLTRDRLPQRELAKVIDTATRADHQLLTLDMILVTAKEIRVRSRRRLLRSVPKVQVEDDDF
jgi:transposase